MPKLDIKPNIDYLKTPQAILKIVQIVTLMIAFSCITDCCDGGKPIQVVNKRYTVNTVVNYWIMILRSAHPKRDLTESALINYPRNVSFFLAVTILGWLLAVFFFTFFCLRFQERFKQINWEMMVMIISIVWSVLLLLCCSLMGSTSSTAYIIRPTGSSSSAGEGVGGEDFLKRYIDTMVTGVVFGFFSLIAFVAEAVFLFWQFWSKRKAGGHGNNPDITKVTEAPGPSQIPPSQTLGAPPQYEQVENLPGQMPNTAGQSGQYSAGQPVGNPGQPGGQPMVMYPSGQQYQAASGQPVQMWQMA